MAADNPNDDIISLEDLVRESAPGEASSSAPVSASGTPHAATGASAVSPAPAAAKASVESGDVSVDDLIAVEDPEFASSIDELKKQGEDAKVTEVEIDTLDLEAAANEKSLGQVVGAAIAWPLSFPLKKLGKKKLAERVSKIPEQIGARLRDGVYVIAGWVRHTLIALLAWLKKSLKALAALPGRAKLTLLLALVLGGLAVFMMRFALTGKLSFGFGPRFLTSFAEVAGGSWEYDPKAPLENFADPLYHPEHVVTLDRLVVNLKGANEGENPMGLFEFFLEASSQEAAVELKDREGETRDLISRSLEQMNYDDLTTVAGKERMKVVIRKNLNLFLNHGQVRRVFIKTIVLKP